MRFVRDFRISGTYKAHGRLFALKSTKFSHFGVLAFLGPEKENVIISLARMSGFY